jgi:hypothetical protein
LAAVLLSAIWMVPYIYTAIRFAFLVFAGHVVTIDDGLPLGGAIRTAISGFRGLNLYSEAGYLASTYQDRFAVPDNPIIRCLIWPAVAAGKGSARFVSFSAACDSW